MIPGLDKKEINLTHFVNELLNKPDYIQYYLEGLTDKNQIYQENCFKILQNISEKHPNFLYPHWDFFVTHMKSKNNYHKTAAIIILSNLTNIDSKNKFDEIFEKFFDTLKSEKTIPPIYLIKNTPKIIKSKPHLEERITNILLNIDSIHQGKQIELVKSAVIESFYEYYHDSSHHKEIMKFVQKQLTSSSPKTQKIAKQFLLNYREN
jgi:hypothetical protein